MAASRARLARAWAAASSIISTASLTMCGATSSCQVTAEASSTFFIMLASLVIVGGDLARIEVARVS